jgi:hypothetical protein
MLDAQLQEHERRLFSSSSGFVAPQGGYSHLAQEMAPNGYFFLGSAPEGFARLQSIVTDLQGRAETIGCVAGWISDGDEDLLVTKDYDQQ